MQTCPEFTKAPIAHLAAASSKSALLSINVAALPPSSNETFLIPAFFVMMLPTVTLPVKLITRGISLVTRAFPTSASP